GIELRVRELDAVAPLQRVDELVLIGVHVKRRGFRGSVLSADRREGTAGVIGPSLEYRHTARWVLDGEPPARRNRERLDGVMRHPSERLNRAPGRQPAASSLNPPVA